MVPSPRLPLVRRHLVRTSHGAPGLPSRYKSAKDGMGVQEASRGWGPRTWAEWSSESQDQLVADLSIHLISGAIFFFMAKMETNDLSHPSGSSGWRCHEHLASDNWIIGTQVIGWRWWVWFFEEWSPKDLSTCKSPNLWIIPDMAKRRD